MERKNFDIKPPDGYTIIRMLFDLEKKPFELRIIKIILFDRTCRVVDTILQLSNKKKSLINDGLKLDNMKEDRSFNDVHVVKSFKI